MEFKIIAVAPAGHATGGVEAVHQLVDSLRRQTYDAYVSYMPEQSSVTPQYANYNIAVTDIKDVDTEIIIIPESMFHIVNQFKNARIVLWWLSIDFYLGFNRESLVKDYLRYFKRLLLKKVVTFSKLKQMNILHLSQSVYSQDYLIKRGIQSIVVSDYLNDGFLHDKLDCNKLPQVLYNPAKGFIRTAKILDNCKSVKFIPLRGYNRDQVHKLMCESLVYIDFGNHPGKDRMPREAALCGCVVITNLRGSANFYSDVPTPLKYKINDCERGYENVASLLIKNVLNDPELAVSDFENYKNQITNQKSVFDLEVKNFVKIANEFW